MTDGGMADAIPIRRAVSDGMKKNLIILTQQSRYRKKLKTSKLITTRYFWHRNFVKTMRERPYKYNADLDFVEELVHQKQALAYYPEISLPKLITRDPVKLNELYEHGYEVGKRVVQEAKEFFNV
jgi:predicted patatin/cPLA2 family phospholipase